MSTQPATTRRRLLLALAGRPAAALAAAATTTLPGRAGAAAADLAARAGDEIDDDDGVRAGRVLRFARDHGAHAGSAIEWWYLSAWLGTAQAPSHGLQLSFFRHRTGLATALPGRLAPRQLLFAHAAITTLGAAARHRHAERRMRWNGEPAAAGEPQAAGAARADAHVWIGDWHLRRDGERWLGQARAPAASPPWALRVAVAPTQPLLLQGEHGFSRKGPLPTQASHYYSLPQLQVQAWLELDGRRLQAQGRGWLDHEWSQSLLAPEAVGWDWIGINLFDGGALTAFQLRRADGSTLWAGGSLRTPGALALRRFAPHELRWRPERRWHSAATGADFPTLWQLETPAGRLRVRALLEAQELDARRSTGTLYWEGLSELLDAGGRRIGLGYLEMTGYAGRLQL